VGSIPIARSVNFYLLTPTSKGYTKNIGVIMKRLKTKHKYALTLGVALIIIALVDFLNIDSFLYYNLCNIFYNLGLRTLTCATFYDLPFWQTELVAGFLLTGYFAFHALEVHLAKSK
jgi:hypothetical protein